jgi:hypothetical protein
MIIMDIYRDGAAGWGKIMDIELLCTPALNHLFVLTFACAWFGSVVQTDRYYTINKIKGGCNL